MRSSPSPWNHPSVRPPTGMVDIVKRGIIVGFVSADVVVMIQRTRNDGGQVSRAQKALPWCKSAGTSRTTGT